MKLFKGKANCSGCHVPPLFTDYSDDNLGIPKNPLNPFYSEPTHNPKGTNWVDEGLGGYLAGTGFYPASISTPELGKFQVPTLRNVAKRPSPSFVKAYGHNGYFKSLAEIVHFCNTRDVSGAKWKGAPWPAAEYAANMNTSEIGNLGLTARQEKAIVAFLKTLSDGYRAAAHRLSREPRWRSGRAPERHRGSMPAVMPVGEAGRKQSGPRDASARDSTRPCGCSCRLRTPPTMSRRHV